MNSVNERLILIIIQFICAGTLFSQEIIIRGTEPPYAGKEITFYKYVEHIAYSKQELGRCIVDENGDFLIRFHSGNTIQVFADLGKYWGYLFTEPGKEYTIKLPPRADKTTADQLNPYFRQEAIHLGVLSPGLKGLNANIQRFDAVYTPLFRKYAFGAYIQKQFNDLDSALQVLNESFRRDSNPFFRCYVQYKCELLKRMSLGKRTLNAFPSANYSTAVLYNNPAFSDWLQQVYNNYFQYLNRLDPVQYPLHEAINVKRSYTMLLELVRKADTFPNDTVAEMILMKGLYDGYFSGEFYDMAILELLDSLIQNSPHKDHVLMAEKIKQRLTRLRIGNIPPDFMLPSFDDDTLTRNDLKGKYIYLNFSTPVSYLCRNHLTMLKSLQEKYEEVLEVITISVDEDTSRMKDLIQEMDLSWEFLYSRFESKILEDYDVRAYPTYYLLDPGGRLLLSPAPGPDNGFEQRFVGILRKKEP